MIYKLSNFFLVDHDTSLFTTENMSKNDLYSILRCTYNIRLDNHIENYFYFCEKTCQHDILLFLTFFFLSSSTSYYLTEKKYILQLQLMISWTSQILDVTNIYVPEICCLIFSSAFPFPGSDKWAAGKHPAQGYCNCLQAKAVYNLLCSPTIACTNLDAPRDGHSHLATPIPVIHLGRVQDGNVLAPPEPQPSWPLPRRRRQQRWQQSKMIGMTGWVAGNVYGGD